MVAWLGDVASVWFWWIAVGGFLGFIAIETIRPERQAEFPGWRWADHLSLYAGCLVLSYFIDPTGYVVAMVPQPATFFGAIERGLGQAGVLVAGLLLLDLFCYALHWLQHAVFLLWRFHAVHHSDIEMDASTAMRHHPLAYLQVAVCVGVVFPLLGLPVWVFPIYGVILFLAALFQHVNVGIPPAVSRILGWVLICPDMHRVHHSTKPAHYNSNYGNVLSVWDRMFGTLRLPVESEARLSYGLGDATAGSAAFATWKMPFVVARPQPLQTARAQS